MNAAAYRDMIHLSRPISRHPKMSVENRAKLFAPFSALRGFDIEILTKEQDRLLAARVALEADQQEQVCQTLNGLRKGQPVTVTHFALVKELAGIPLGEYVTRTGKVRRVDDFYQVLVLDTGSVAFEISKSWKSTVGKERKQYSDHARAAHIRNVLFERFLA